MAPPSASPVVISRRTPGNRPQPHGPHPSGSSRRWPLLVALLVAEVVALTVSFDSAHTQAAIEPLLDSARVTFQVLAVAAAIWLVLRDEADQGIPRPVRPPARICWPFIPLHLASLLGFFRLTAALSDGRPGHLAPSGRAAAWMVMGGATLATWLAIGLPPSLWAPWVRRRRGPLLACLALGLLAWALARSAESLWRPLAGATLRVVHHLLRMVDPQATCDPASYRVGTPAFQVVIAPGCSGYEGIGMIAVLIAVYLWVDRRSLRFPHALVLLPLGASIIWLANAARIAALIWIAARGYRDVALGGFHSQAGWLAFLAVGLGLIALARLRPFVAIDRGDEPIAGDRWPSAPYLVPLLVAIAATMLTRAASGDFDRLYPLRVAAVGGSLWAFRGAYARWRWEPSWQAVAIGMVAFVAWIALIPLSPDVAPGSSDPRIGLAGSSRAWPIAWIAFRIAGSVITAPLAEELAFRAYLTRRLIKSDFSSSPMGTFSWPSFLVSSALFGLLHGARSAGTAAGMLFALALYRRGRVADAVVAHATANACLGGYVLATGNWWLWD